MSDSPLPDFKALKKDSPIDILFIAGEHSGDEQAAALLRKTLATNPELNVAAIGGEKLENAGAHLLYNPLESAVVGLIEVIKHFDYLKAMFHKTLEWIEIHQPRVVCFVDYPGLNLRIAKKLYDRGISAKAGGKVRLVFYISPQIWAWKAKRRFTMAKHLDALGVIFPFEVECYRDTDLPVAFIGHPFVDSDYKLPVTHDPKGSLLLLPGSRKAPIQRIFPVMVDAYNRIRKDHPELQAKVMYPTEKIRLQLLSIIEQHGSNNPFELIPNSESFTARAVLTSSGTISLVCALAAIPGLLVYRTNPLSYAMAMILVKIRTVGIANIILGEFIHPEFIQSAMKAEVLYSELSKQLDDPATIQATQKLSLELKSRLITEDQQDSGTWMRKQLLEADVDH